MLLGVRVSSLLLLLVHFVEFELNILLLVGGSSSKMFASSFDTVFFLKFMLEDFRH